MALYFNKVEFLSYDHKPVTFDAGLRYKVSKNFTINGHIHFNSDDGTSEILSGQQEILLNAVDYQPIFLNNVYFGEGKVQNISFDNGTLTRLNRYTYNIECYDSGNLYNALSGAYSGISWSSGLVHQIADLSENFSFNQENNGDKTYKHDVQIRFNSGFNSVHPIELAKLFAQQLYDNANLVNFIGNYNQTGRIKYFSESYNLVNNECRFSATVPIPGNDSGNYAFTYTDEVNTNIDGITTVKENGQVQGLVEDKYFWALSGFNIQQPLIFPRVSGIFLAWNNTGDNYPLNMRPVSADNTHNIFVGQIDYNYVYTNDPKLKDTYSWDRVLTLSKDENNYTQVNEQGTIQGYGRAYLDKYTNALSGYTIIKPSIFPRISGFYVSGTNPVYNLTQVQASLSRDKIDGKITYQDTYTDDNAYINVSGIKKENIEVEIDYPVHLINTFNIFNQLQMIQGSNQSTPGHISMKISLVGFRGTDLYTYQQYAKSKLYGYYTIINSGLGDGFLTSASINFTPDINSFSLQADAAFFGYYKAKNDITLT